MTAPGAAHLNTILAHREIRPMASPCSGQASRQIAIGVPRA
jgi:hypothetical protein